MLSNLNAVKHITGLNAQRPINNMPMVDSGISKLKPEEPNANNLDGCAALGEYNKAIIATPEARAKKQ